MARLNAEQKVFIVKALARYMSAKEVADAVRDQFGIEVKSNVIACYNPELLAARDLSAKLKSLFELERKEFLEKWNRIPIANKSVRMQELDRLLHNLKSQPRPNVQLITDVLEQAAKEEGGMFTNRREITGRGGEAIQVDMTTLTPEQKAARVQELIATGLARAGAQE